MILYSFICDDCDYTWDEFCKVGLLPDSCHGCFSPNFRRNYIAETKQFRPDWAPGFNKSMGIKFSGRRDLFEKARGAGFGLYGHGGSIYNNKDKRFYGDEEYQSKVLGKGKIDHKYLEMLQKGIKPEEASDGGS